MNLENSTLTIHVGQESDEGCEEKSVNRKTVFGATSENLGSLSISGETVKGTRSGATKCEIDQTEFGVVR
jgi:hypothetical protein